MDTVAQTRGWQYWLQVLVLAFGWFGVSAAVKCRCHESVWHDAQAKAGLAFVGVVLVRMIAASIFLDRYFRWHVYLVMALASPLWIPMLFDFVLWIRDVCVGGLRL